MEQQKQLDVPQGTKRANNKMFEWFEKIYNTAYIQVQGSCKVTGKSLNNSNNTKLFALKTNRYFVSFRQTILLFFSLLQK